jgi:hypothetical protein
MSAPSSRRPQVDQPTLAVLLIPVDEWSVDLCLRPAGHQRFAVFAIATRGTEHHMQPLEDLSGDPAWQHTQPLSGASST